MSEALELKGVVSTLNMSLDEVVKASLAYCDSFEGDEHAAKICEAAGQIGLHVLYAVASGSRVELIPADG